MIFIDPILAHVDETGRSVGCKPVKSTQKVFVLASNAKEDKSFRAIVVLVVTIIVASLFPQFEWFRHSTGIEAWVPFFVSLLR